MSASDRTIRWIENLAEQEKRIQAGERSALDLTATKDDVLSAETASFVRDLFYHFEYLVGLFNSRVSNPELQIRVLRPSEVPGEITLVRNKMKLLLKSTQPGNVQLSCLKVIGEAVSSQPKTSVMFTGSIEARFGTFHEVDWHFLRNRVSAEQVARHYLTEFVQVSRSPGEH